MTDESSWTSPGSQPPPPPPPPGPAPGAGPGGGQGPGGRPLFVPTGQQQWGPDAAPVHKPGIVALRPLRLGDMFDGAFTAIRQNPRSMIGMAAVVMTWFLLLPTGVSLALAAAGRLGEGPFNADSFRVPAPGEEPPQQEFPVSMLIGYAGQLLAAFAVLVVTGMVVHVVAQAVLGHRVTSGEAWTAVRGRILRLLGLTALGWLLVVVPVLVAVLVGVLLGAVVNPVLGFAVGFVLVVGSVVFVAFAWVRWFILAPAALVLERSGVVASLKRAATLSRGQFWRLLGISLLAQLVAGFASSLLSMPFTLAGMFGFLVVPDSATGLVYVLGTYLGLLVSYSLATPFTAGVTVLQYVDQRIRKEAFDVELIAGSTTGPAA